MVFTIFTYIAAAILIALIANAICETAAGIARVAGGLLAFAASNILTQAAARMGCLEPFNERPPAFAGLLRGNIAGKSRIKMKTSISDRLAAAAANARKLGQGAFKNPVSSILSLCVLMAVTATIITYSQETAPTEKVAVAMTLPADNVELVDVHGRATIVTVLSIAGDKQSVVIRTKDGKEMPILMSVLNASTIEKLTGEKTRIINGVSLPGTYNLRTLDGANSQERVVDITNDGIVIEKNGSKEAIPFAKMANPSIAFFKGTTIREAQLGNIAQAEAKRATSRAMLEQANTLTNRSSERGREFGRMDAKSAARVLANPAADEMQFVEAKKLLWSRDYNTISSGEGNGMAWVANDRFVDHFVYPSDIAKELKLDEIPLNEKVSLRPEFEKFGIGPMSQSFDELGCQYQSGYKVMNYWLAKKGMPKVTLDQFWNIGSNIKLSPKVNFTVLQPHKDGRTLTMKFFGTMLGAHIGTQPKRMSLVTGNKELSYELAKHMLRNGRPIIVEVPSKIALRHVVAVVGFETTNGVTQFEVLDHNYYWEPNLRLISDSWAFWYE